ncbi:MAG: hypothetical protein JJU03_02915 [Idiomarina sp.]|nr:hypothetical protein [Idiomarina sp.]
MLASKICTVALGLLFSTAAMADSAPSLELSEGWYEGYDELFFDYKGIQISEDGNHRLLTSHLSWGMAGFHNIHFNDENIQCSSVECVIEIPELDHEGHRNRLVLSPTPTGSWYVMQTSAGPDGELVITVTYELKENNNGSDGYMFASRYRETLQNMPERDEYTIDGIWIGLRKNNFNSQLVALEFEQGEPATLLVFSDGNVNEMVFPADEVAVSERALSMMTSRHGIEYKLALDNLGNTQLTGDVVRTLSDGQVIRNSIKLTRLRPTR